jgi:cob(I)alamin adenosyltransferase
MKIYTKTGDQGTSTCYYGQYAKPKSSEIFDALGDLDELNASVGVAVVFCIQEDLEDIAKYLRFVQSILLDIGAALAIDDKENAEELQSKFLSRLNENMIYEMELSIDSFTAELQPLKQFILPGGTTLAAAELHRARTICRRAERSFIRVTYSNDHLNVKKYLNRLSDYLFTIARYATFHADHSDVVYVSPPSSSSA